MEILVGFVEQRMLLGEDPVRDPGWLPLSAGMMQTSWVLLVVVVDVSGGVRPAVAAAPSARTAPDQACHVVCTGAEVCR